MPRLFGDLADLLESPLHPAHLIRVKYQLTDREYRVRAEVPGVDPVNDIQVSVDDGMLTIEAVRWGEEPARLQS